MEERQIQGFKHYPNEDAVYLHLRNLPYDHGYNLDTMRGIDYAADNQLIGMVFLGVSRGVNVDDLPEQARVARLLEEHGIRVLSTRRRRNARLDA